MMNVLMPFAKDSQLSKDFYRKASKYIKYLSEVLDLTKEHDRLFYSPSLSKTKIQPCINLRHISMFSLTVFVFGWSDSNFRSKMSNVFLKNSNALG